jgi:hypothetical protein
MKVAQLVLEVDGALEFIVEEEPFDGGPQGVGSEMGLVDDVEDGLGDGVEDPIDDARVDELPLASALCRRCWRLDVRRVKVKGDWDVGTYVDLWTTATAAGSGGLRSESKAALLLEGDDAMDAEVVANRLKKD